MQFFATCFVAFSVVAYALYVKLDIKKGTTTKPPTYPSFLPIFEEVFWMVYDAPRFIDKISKAFKGIPTRLRLLVIDLYVVSGPDNIKAVCKETDLHTRVYKSLSLVNMFKMPKETLAFWMWEDSGVGSSPHPQSTVPAHLRVEYMTYLSVHEFLTGSGLKPFADRFIENLISQLSRRTDLDNDWLQIVDLWEMVRVELFAATLRAMCGDYLLKLSPGFVEDYWNFAHGLHILARGYPRWLKPDPYKTRDKCIDSVKKWHTFIQPYLRDEQLANSIWNPYYGAELVKYRQAAWSKMPAMNADAAAIEDLGLIWAANGNSVPASFWMLIEILQRPALLLEVQSIIDRHRIQSSNADSIAFDWKELCNDPLLQSLYAETMRTRVASFVFRSPDRHEFQLGQYKIPKHAVMLISGWHGQMDKEEWEEGNARPVEEFWPERFLERGKAGSDPNNDKAASAEQFKFSIEKYAASWLPYGGGQRMCPGRHFNKQEMICGLVAMLSMFDVKMVGSHGLPKCDMRGFGFGALLPDRKSPVQIRKRPHGFTANCNISCHV